MRRHHNVSCAFIKRDEALAQQPPHPLPDGGGTPPTPLGYGSEGQSSSPQVHVPQTFIKASLKTPVTGAHPQRYCGVTAWNYYLGCN